MEISHNNAKSSLMIYKKKIGFEKSLYLSPLNPIFKFDFFA